MGNPNHLPAGGSTGGQFTSASFTEASANLANLQSEAEKATGFTEKAAAEEKVVEAQKAVNATPEGVRALKKQLSQATSKFDERNISRELDEARVSLAVQRGVPEGDLKEFHSAVQKNLKGKPVAVPAGHANAKDLNRMEADGWTPFTGTYGTNENDRSVRMLRVQPEMGGYFVVEFRDRDINGQREVTQSGHFIVPGRGSYQANRERAFVPQEGKHTLNGYKREIGKCDVSGEYLGFKNLKYVPYAGAVAPKHYDQAMADYKKKTGNI